MIRRHFPRPRQFSMLDANQDGSLSPDELFDGLCKRGYEQDELQNLFAMLDTNGDGKVSLTEYLDGMESVHGAKMVGVHSPTRQIVGPLACCLPCHRPSPRPAEAEAERTQRRQEGNVCMRCGKEQER